MTATAAQITQIRRMTAEPVPATTYIDVVIAGYIEAYPLIDERGETPYTWSSATPPVKVTNTEWVATYDLHSAAADIWEEKAANWADKYDFSADGGNYSRSKVYEQMMARVRYHRARRASKTMTLIKWPEETLRTGGNDFPWIGNLAEPRDP
jgi:hypothetical protein